MKKNLYLLLFLLASLSMQGKEASPRTTAKKLNKQIEILLNKLENGQHSTIDSAAYYNDVFQMLKTALICDFYDVQSLKNQQDTPSYRLKNGKHLNGYLEKLIDAGMYYYRHMQNETAINVFRLYLDCTESALFHEQKYIQGQAAYYVSLLAYGKKDYITSEHFADVALKDINYAKEAAEIKVNCMRMGLKNKVDSIQYLSVLSALHREKPEHELYFKLLIEYLSSPGHKQLLKEFATEEVRIRPNNKWVWALKGETDMKSQQWDDAIVSFNKTLAIDSTMIKAIYNIGLCYCSKAMYLRRELENDSGKVKRKDYKLIREELDHAAAWLEKAKRLDPNEDIVKWSFPLKKVKKVLGN